jgi:hypothetical protein
LANIDQDDVIREGFPDMTPKDFMNMFAEANNTHEAIWVNRIEFEYLEWTHVG